MPQISTLISQALQPLITSHTPGPGTCRIYYSHSSTSNLAYAYTSTTSETAVPDFSNLTFTNIDANNSINNEYLRLFNLTTCTSTNPMFYYIIIKDTLTNKESDPYLFCSGAPNKTEITQIESTPQGELKLTYNNSSSAGYSATSYLVNFDKVRVRGFNSSKEMIFNPESFPINSDVESPWTITVPNTCSKVFMAMSCIATKSGSPTYYSGFMSQQIPDFNNTETFVNGAGKFPNKPIFSVTSNNGTIICSGFSINTPVTAYVVSTDGGKTTYEISSISTNTVTIRLASDTGLPLKTNTKYAVRIAAKNTVGLGIYSSIKLVTLVNTQRDLPTCVTDVSCVPINGNSLDVTITPPSPNTAITYYWQCKNSSDVETSTGAYWHPITVSSSAATTSFNIPNLSLGTSYDVFVVSANAAGTSTEMFKATSTIVVPPSSPSALTIAPGDTTLSVTITPPNDSSVVTGYKWQSVLKDTLALGGTWTDVVGTTFVVTGLTNYADYDIYVKATNPAGDGPAIKSTSKPYPAPSAPSSLSFVADDESCTVTIVPPTDSSIITGYKWQLLGLGGSITDGGWNSITGTSFNVSSLTNYLAYNVYVETYNSVGTSAFFIYIQIMSYPPPSPPLSLLATPGNTTLTIDITPPSDLSIITGYRWQHTNDSTVLANTVPPGTTQFTIPDIVNYQTYKIFVESVNDVGDSESSEISAMPYPKPSEPQSITVAAFRSGEVDISIVRPSDESVITNYLWQVVAKDAAVTLLAWNSTTLTSFTVTGLVNGTEYDLYVKANNSVGSGTAVKLGIMASTTPSAPTSLSYTPGDHSLTVSFQVSTDGGKAITSHKVSTDGGVTFASFTGTTSPIVILKTSDTDANLINGTEYDIIIKAVNENGESLGSSALPAIPSRKPLAPTITHIIPGLHQLSVHFTQVDSDAGAPVQNIEYKVNDAAYVESGTTTSPVVITDLTDLETYAVTLRAKNLNGSGDASNTESMIVTDKPTKPTVSIVERSLAGYKLRLEWTDANPVAPSDQFTIYKNNELFKVVTPDT